MAKSIFLWALKFRTFWNKELYVHSGSRMYFFMSAKIPTLRNNHVIDGLNHHNCHFPEFEINDLDRSFFFKII